MSEGPSDRDDSTFRLPPDSASTALSFTVIRGATAHVLALPEKGRFRVGRGDDCWVRIQDHSVSRQHAEFDRRDVLRVRDLGSVNGTAVNGQRLAQNDWRNVGLGDVVDLGGALLVLQASVPPVEEPSPEQASIIGGRTQRLKAVVPEPLAPAPERPFVVRDAAMERIHQLIEWVAPSPLNVLVLGETGVGKEIVAEQIHRRSKRAPRKFVRLHCAALAPTLLESELFGHVRGAFTGADQDRMGLLESAEGGTVFLDEVGDIPLSVQVKLLRVIEEKMVLRVGSTSPKTLDVRFVAATHRDLRAAIARGEFREDLFYRINGVTIAVPPLRERVGEIADLATHFAAQLGTTMPAVARVTFHPDAIVVLQRYRWPGNVRELRNAVERAVVLARGAIVLPEHLPDEVRGESDGDDPYDSGEKVVAPALRDQMAALERQRIIEALRRHDGNQTRAAEALDMPRRTLIKRMHAYGIPFARDGKSEG